MIMAKSFPFYVYPFTLNTKDVVESGPLNKLPGLTSNILFSTV